MYNKDATINIILSYQNNILIYEEGEILWKSERAEAFMQMHIYGMEV